MTRSVVHCKRCGVACAATDPGNPNARPFRRSKRGFCTACVVCNFFQDPDDGIGNALQPGFDPRNLLLPHIQQHFLRVLEVGNSELMLGDIDWHEVIEKWSIGQ